MNIAETSVIAEVRNHVGHLVLNRPTGLNTLTLPMIRELHSRLMDWANDPAVNAIVLGAVGDKAFCAGGDIRSLYDSHQSGDELHMTFFQEEYALDRLIHAYKKPVLALMDGFVLGGGMGLVQGASLRVISENARVGMPEVGIGYFPDVGGSYFLSRLSGELGTYLGVTGIHIGAVDALYAGLADWCVPKEAFPELEQRLDALLWSARPAEDLRKLVSELSVDITSESELRSLQPAIDLHFSQPTVAAIRESLLAESLSPYRNWAEDTIRLMDTKSPLAMSVTLELLRRGRTLSLEACFAMELHLDRQWFAKGDIMEGVRALLVDKDKSPCWKIRMIDEVTPEQVAEFFTGL